MRQITLSLRTGAVDLVETPIPQVSDSDILIDTHCSVISAGTEGKLIAFGRAGLLAKAHKEREKVAQLWEKIRSDGLLTAYEAVSFKLGEPVALGYCNAGVVAEAGSGASAFAPGDRVVTNGQHADTVRVGRNLAARIPDGVDFEAAAFAPLAAIALQGVRLAAPTLGESVVVYGLGVVGLLTVQILRANGCRVIGIDFDTSRLKLAECFGATALDVSGGEIVSQVLSLTAGQGADAVLLTLASDSDGPVADSAAMSRKRGRMVLVGVTGLNLKRSDFYKKELSFQVSCSYGPGRYDHAYEQQGLDYPFPYVRWTEQRNFEAVLDLMARGALDPVPLISHRFVIDAAPEAYELILSDEPSLAIVLTYPQAEKAGSPPRKETVVRFRATGEPSPFCIGVIGAGNFATRTLLPEIHAAGARMCTVASATGLTGLVAARRFDFEQATTDVNVILDDSDIDTVFVVTRHNTHADLALRALRAGKNVFVEKPLALHEAELDELEQAAADSGRILTVGFNRRFAPAANSLSDLLGGRRGPLALNITVNAGAIPLDHWTQDPEVGGGRIVGEACHFIDLARFFVGAPISELEVISARASDGRVVEDVANLAILFGDGSIASIQYFSNGPRGYPKERVECFWDGKAAVIENWRRLRTIGIRRSNSVFRSRTDKGHRAEIAAFATAVRTGGLPPIALEELFEVSRWAIRAAAMTRR